MTGKVFGLLIFKFLLDISREPNKHIESSFPDASQDRQHSLFKKLFLCIMFSNFILFHHLQRKNVHVNVFRKL